MRLSNPEVPIEEIEKTKNRSWTGFAGAHARNRLQAGGVRRHVRLPAKRIRQSEKLRGMLRAMGYEMTGDEALADIIVLNTCAVREHAEMRRVRKRRRACAHQKAEARPDHRVVRLHDAAGACG